MAPSRHTGLVVGFNVPMKCEALEELPTYKPDSMKEVVDVVKEMKMMSLPYVDALYCLADQPVSVFEALELHCLKKEMCERMFSIAST
ncbi:hypothetical protein Hanom_Chr16g01429291 [Helianthus anomalus]